MTPWKGEEEYDGKKPFWWDWFDADDGEAVCGARGKFEFLGNGGCFGECLGATGLIYALCHTNDWNNQQFLKVDDNVYG